MNPGVTGGTDAEIGLVAENAKTAGGEGVKEVAGAGGRSVVDDDNFELFVGLAQDAIDGIGQGVSAIIALTPCPMPSIASCAKPTNSSKLSSSTTLRPPAPATSFTPSPPAVFAFSATRPISASVPPVTPGFIPPPATSSPGSIPMTYG